MAAQQVADDQEEAREGRQKEGGFQVVHARKHGPGLWRIKAPGGIMGPMTDEKKPAAEAEKPDGRPQARPAREAQEGRGDRRPARPRADPLRRLAVQRQGDGLLSACRCGARLSGPHPARSDRSMSALADPSLLRTTKKMT